MNIIKTISGLTAALVFVLAILAFVLSYSSLQHLALPVFGSFLSYLWPLLLDFAMIVYSLAILRGNLRGEKTLYPWVLTIAFGGLALVANVFDVTTFGLGDNVVPIVIKGLSPVALLLSFELLMSMIRAEIVRADTVKSIEALNSERQRLTIDIGQLSKEIEQKRQQVVSDNVIFQPIEIKNPVNTGVNSVNMSEIRAAKDEEIVNRRRALVDILTQEGDIGASALTDKLSTLGVECSRGTVYNDLKALNNEGVLHKNGNGWEVSK